MSYYKEADSHIRNKVNVVLEFSNYGTEVKLKDAAGVNTCNLAVKSDFIVLKAEVNKLDVNKLFYISTNLNNVKAKVDDFDVDKLKTVPIDLKHLSDVLSNKIFKSTKFNTLKMKLNKLLRINQYKTDKQNLEKTFIDVDKKHQTLMV